MPPGRKKTICCLDEMFALPALWTADVRRIGRTPLESTDQRAGRSKLVLAEAGRHHHQERAHACHRDPSHGPTNSANAEREYGQLCEG